MYRKVLLSVFSIIVGLMIILLTIAVGNQAVSSPNKAQQIEEGLKMPIR
ncbi:MAG TPA: hypothetical protein VMV81_00915 [Phycisphaerae bacterium]|nr:hypothetical protein [Phycisphaerae bacterium]